MDLSFTDLNNDILIKIMSYLPINYLKLINKQLFLLHNEYYYRLYLENHYHNKVNKIYEKTCKRLVNDGKQFESLLFKAFASSKNYYSEYRKTLMTYKKSLAIYILENITWEEDDIYKLPDNPSYYRYGECLYHGKLGHFNFKVHEEFDSGCGMNDWSLKFDHIDVYRKDDKILEIHANKKKDRKQFYNIMWKI